MAPAASSSAFWVHSRAVREFLRGLSVATRRLDAIECGYVASVIIRTKAANPVLGRELQHRNRGKRPLVHEGLARPASDPSLTVP